MLKCGSVLLIFILMEGLLYWSSVGLASHRVDRSFRSVMLSLDHLEELALLRKLIELFCILLVRVMQIILFGAVWGGPFARLEKFALLLFSLFEAAFGSLLAHSLLRVRFGRAWVGPVALWRPTLVLFRNLSTALFLGLRLILYHLNEVVQNIVKFDLKVQR